MRRQSFQLAILVPLTIGSAILSPTSQYQYRLCGKMAYGGSGEIYEVVRALKSDDTTSCDSTTDRQILKCNLKGQPESYDQEFRMLSKLSDSGFTSRPFEIFLDNEDKNRPCISMERVGINLQSLRMSNRGQWPSETLGSIGVALIDAVDKLHNNYHVIHKDLHLGNVCLGDNQTSDKLYIIDFGEMKELQTDIAGTTEFYKLEELPDSIEIIYFGKINTKHFLQIKKLPRNLKQIQIETGLFDDVEKIFREYKESKEIEFEITRVKGEFNFI